MLRVAGDGMDSSADGSHHPRAHLPVPPPRYVPWEPCRGSVDAYSPVVQEAIQAAVGHGRASHKASRVRHKRAVSRAHTLLKHQQEASRATETGSPADDWSAQPNAELRRYKPATIIVKRKHRHDQERHNSGDSTYSAISTTSSPANLMSCSNHSSSTGANVSSTLVDVSSNNSKTVTDSSLFNDNADSVSSVSGQWSCSTDDEPPQQIGRSASTRSTLSRQLSGESSSIYETDSTLLSQQLKLQMEINQELKQLLVASVGEDVNHKLDSLLQTKARMSERLNKSSEHTTDLYEQLERLSIQCDVYRSKFLAMKTMSSELSAVKSSLLRGHYESHEVLLDLLQEHEEIRKNLADTYKTLYQVKCQLYTEGVGCHLSRPDALVTHSCNLLHLSSSAHRLAVHIRDSISNPTPPPAPPPAAGGDSVSPAAAAAATPAVSGERPHTGSRKPPLESRSDETETPAEKRAVQFISSSSGSGAGHRPRRGVGGGGGGMIERFHPTACTNPDLTHVACCHGCTGDVETV